MIIQFPKKVGRVYAWARAYATIMFQSGRVPAGRYARDHIPQQFHKSIDPLVREEYNKIKQESERE